jgi:hypothetical protein
MRDFGDGIKEVPHPERSAERVVEGRTALNPAARKIKFYENFTFGVAPFPA